MKLPLRFEGQFVENFHWKTSTVPRPTLDIDSRPRFRRSSIPGPASRSGPRIWRLSSRWSSSSRRSARSGGLRFPSRCAKSIGSGGPPRSTGRSAWRRPSGRRPASTTGPHLLQVGGGESGGEPQAQHGGRPGLLQQAGGSPAHRDRDGRRAVGERAGLCLPGLCAGMQGLYGARLLRTEALPARHDGDLGGPGRAEPEPGYPRWASDSGPGPPLHREPGDRHLRGGWRSTSSRPSRQP